MTAQQTTLVKPDDFAQFWQAVDDELTRYPIASEQNHAPRHDTDFCTGYDVELTGIGPYRLFAHLSIPNGTGPFPALLALPRYGSVNNPAHWNDRQRYVTVTLCHRGQRLADKPFAATYPGLLTLGIDDPQTYIYRAIVADCIRGLEFLLSLPMVDRTRIALAGDDLAIMTAARRPGAVSAVHLTGIMFHRAMEVRKQTDAYPIEELNDELRLTPEREGAIARTLSYFEPQFHAPAVGARVLVAVGDNMHINGPEWLEGLIGAIGGETTSWQLTHEGQRDHDAMEAWLAAAQGVEPRPRIWEVQR